MTDWSKPIEISDVELAFPANAVEKLMPTEEECNEGLTALSEDEQKKWKGFQHTWFVKGLSPTVEFYLKEGIDGNLALRHLAAIQGSYAPRHQHKVAAIVYLASLWFDDVKL